MIQLAEAIALTAALLVASGGIGGTILRWAQLDDPGETQPARPLSFGVSVGFGLALLIALGGVGFVLRIPVAVTVVTFSVVGIALQTVRVVRQRPQWTAVWIALLAIEAVVLGAVLFTQAGVGIAFHLNVCDDTLAYLPEARRLLATHTLLEPWSTRRLQNFGGQTFLQAGYMQFLGKDALGLTETLLPVALLWALLSTGLRRPLTRVLGLGLVVLLPFFDVPRMNTAGTLLPVPFLVALGALVLVLRRASQQSNRRGTVVAAVAVGVTAAALVSIRTNVAPAAGLTAVVGAATIAGTARDRLRAVGVCVVSGIAAFVPWSVAMWESSGTPLYPLLRGNENSRAPQIGGTNSIDLGDALETARHLLTSSPYPAALVVLLVVIVVARKVFPATAMVAALMAGAGLINVVLLILNLSLVPTEHFNRYVFPLTAGVLFFVIRGALARLDEEPSGARRAVIAPASLTLVAVAAFLWIGTRDPDAIVKVPNIEAARDFVEQAADVHDPDTAITSNASVADARAALAAVPRGGQTILAVSEPDAFLATGADLQSMDQIPGGAAPRGEFPFFSGPRDKVRTLRRDGYDHLVVSPSSNNLCFGRERFIAFLQSREPEYRRLARFVLDFFDDMDRLARRYPHATQMVNGFYVIDLRAVPGTAPGRAHA
ncbi:MAG TPA: hypothetical protein VKE97_06490 [Acidimicrobiia bacterium]|nr:hypothetical protein [Acidimicrobiia bacterium]